MFEIAEKGQESLFRSLVINYKLVIYLLLKYIKNE